MRVDEVEWRGATETYNIFSHFRGRPYGSIKKGVRNLFSTYSFFRKQGLSPRGAMEVSKKKVPDTFFQIFLHGSASHEGEVRIQKCVLRNLRRRLSNGCKRNKKRGVRCWLQSAPHTPVKEQQLSVSSQCVKVDQYSHHNLSLKGLGPPRSG